MTDRLRFGRLAITALRAELQALPADKGYHVNVVADDHTMDPSRPPASLRPLDELLRLAEERWQQLAAPLSPVNGGGFLTILDGQVVAADDRGLINENALSQVLDELLHERTLTFDMLAAIFGVDHVYAVLARIPPINPALVEALATQVAHKLREEGLVS